jgi:hypothetical protein
MTNTINTIKSNGGVLAKLAAGALVDNLQFGKSISKADASDYDGKNGYSAGDTVYISKPARFIPTSSFDVTSSIQGIVEEKVALPLDIISSVAIELDSQELASTINIKSIYERAVKPAVAAIAQDVEKVMLLRAAKATYNHVGTAGATVYDTDTMLSANQKLDEMLAPMDGERFALLSPAAQRSAVNARKGLFQSSSEIASQYKKGYMGEADGFTYLSNNLMPRLTNGADVTGIAVEASVVTIANGMSTLGVDGVATGATITAGTTFTISGVNAVHPQTKVDLGYLQQFVVTADAAENGSNQATLSISPAIYYTTTDPRQNVSAAPVDETGALVFYGAASTTYTENIVYHKDAFRMVSVPLVMPNNAELAVQETYKGITVAIVRDFDVIKRRMITRVDFLGGFCAPRGEWACRVRS